MISDDPSAGFVDDGSLIESHVEWMRLTIISPRARESVFSIVSGSRNEIASMVARRSSLTFLRSAAATAPRLELDLLKLHSTQTVASSALVLAALNSKSISVETESFRHDKHLRITQF